MNQSLLLCLLSAWLVLARAQNYGPGDVISGTDYQQVSGILREVLPAGGDVDASRRCAVGVANLGSADLINPLWYLYSGNIYSSAPAVIQRKETGLELFYKKGLSTYGTSGVLSYEISGTDYRLTIMWEVPWNSLIYHSTFNIKIYNKNIPVNKDMYEQMNSVSGHMNRNQGWMEKVEYGIETRGTLTGDDLAQFYVSVNADNHDRILPPSLHTECDFNASWLGSYCWQECTPNGYCWVNKKCSSDGDCQGPLQCYDPCKKRTLFVDEVTMMPPDSKDSWTDVN